MGNKCCSKRQDPDTGCPGGKKNDLSSVSQQKYPNGSIDSRYTPDPNRGVKVDFIRHRQPTRKRRVVIALYNYTAREDTDVSFMKGDRMEVLDDTESDWWRVCHLTTRQEGLIPWNFVAEERSVNSEEYVSFPFFFYEIENI